MKKYYYAVLLLPILLIPLVERYEVFAPELFGDGTMYMVGRDRIVGYVDAWGGWAIYGTRHDCRIVQLTGQPIQNAEGKIPCHMVTKKGDRFTGWIDFRGHPRKFCGAPDRESIPPKCYGD